MRILVCGGRDYRDSTCVTDSMERLRRAGLISLLIHAMPAAQTGWPASGPGTPVWIR
ncbi:DUF2493 domain-containing protein [Alcanivorax sediminis]|uniref:DUF2493 domain-containing protein n=1 Tax=Alcanivorax sediminis TaxID=2663008 RepID=UPI001F461D11|nr:DUF2493 domain-containing protein [Alcanivorax sediminis]